MDAQKRTTALVYLASIVEKADEQVLPSVYLFVGKSLGAKPSQLGTLTLCRALVQAVSSPLSGLLGDRYDRTLIIAFGCFLWGLMTSAIAMAASLQEAMVYAGFNGIGLALVIPCCQSLIADFYPSETRGRAFGMMQLIAAVGVMGGGMYATNIGGGTMFGMEGWRFALHTVAIVSGVTGVLVWWFASDPRLMLRPSRSGEAARLLEDGIVSGANDSFSKAAGTRSRVVSGSGTPSPVTFSPTSQHKIETKSVEAKPPGKWSLGEAWRDIRWMLSIRSFQIVILQGVVGSTPWNAMVFFTLWFQLLGFTDFTASALLATFNLGCALGGFVGGTIADKLSVKYPNSGRILAAQFSVLSGLPFSFLLLKVLPRFGVEDQSIVYGNVLFFMGLLISWCGACCNSPVFADIVPDFLYSKIYAFDRSFEGAIAATAAPVVGIVSERCFGFKGDVSEGREPGVGNANPANASALGSSLLVCLIVPWVLCLLFYTGLHWTYPRDRNLAKQMQRKNVSSI